jgi:hypothetical protein
VIHAWDDGIHRGTGTADKPRVVGLLDGIIHETVGIGTQIELDGDID